MRGQHELQLVDSSQLKQDVLARRLELRSPFESPEAPRTAGSPTRSAQSYLGKHDYDGGAFFGAGPSVALEALQDPSRLQQVSIRGQRKHLGFFHPRQTIFAAMCPTCGQPDQHHEFSGFEYVSAVVVGRVHELLENIGSKIGGRIDARMFTLQPRRRQLQWMLQDDSERGGPHVEGRGFLAQ